MNGIRLFLEGVCAICMASLCLPRKWITWAGTQPTVPKTLRGVGNSWVMLTGFFEHHVIPMLCINIVHRND